MALTFIDSIKLPRKKTPLGEVTEVKNYDVSKGAAVYLSPSESATIQAADGTSLKLFHLAVPRIPAVRARFQGGTRGKE